MQKILYTLFLIAASLGMQAQVTADVTEGCVPLEVTFSGPNLSTYFWDFDDSSGNSDEVSPKRVFDMPGTYNVQLREGAGGALQGTVEITVYADPVIQFEVVNDETDGCAPFFVEFINTSIVDPAVPVTGYLWSFGDGSSSTLQNPTHVYNGEGTFPVTLQIFSSLAECGNVMTFEDYITVSGAVNIGFTLDAIEICDLPATFNITNNTPNEPGYIYSWDFGNGTTSDDREPGSVTYTSAGSYTISLEVDNGDGCVVTRQRTVRAGPPPFALDIPDTLCLNILTILDNNTQAAVFQWTFGQAAFPATSFDRQPRVRFFEPGPQLITLTATGSTGCVSDTAFTVFIELPDATYTPDPGAGCADPVTFTLTANNPSHSQYFWNSMPGGNVLSVPYDDPDRDSFYINRPDTFFYLLQVISQNGCTNFQDSFVVFRDIDAYKVPDVTRGCAPLTVEFSQQSKSIEPIIRYDWSFGDGTTVNDVTGDDQTHTFTQPGEYYVQLEVENDVGCEDKSNGVWIYVGEPLMSDFTIDKTEICLYDSVALAALNMDDRIDAWHFETDEGRNSHCYINPTTSHAFVTAPGTYPVTLEVEYNGCFNTVDVGEVEVSGSKALIQYMTNCADPYTVMLQDSSIGATSTIWTVEGNTFNTADLPDSILNYTFADTGIYTVYLESFDATSTCPPDVDSVQIHVVDLFASFVVEPIVCEGPVLFDATSSVGVDNRCFKGYTWYFPTNRPRRIQENTIEQGLFSPDGDDNDVSIRLEVEDINGCIDDTTITIQVFDLDADFEFGRDRLCFPSEVTLNSLAVSDTTIVSWTWSTTSGQDSMVAYQETNPNNDTIYSVTHIAVDAQGCTDTVSRQIDIYEISSIPSILPNPVCIGDSIFFTATDYTEDGSFLNFDWNVTGPGQAVSSMEQSFGTAFDVSGDYSARLQITEDASGCQNVYEPLNIQVVDIPVAEFTSESSEVCRGDLVEFNNNSMIDGPGGYIWNFGNGSPLSMQENAITAFVNTGTFEVELIALSNAGCADTTATLITVSGPQASFDTISALSCGMGDVTFILNNPIDVLTYTWDFGDGEVASDVSPVTHTYSALSTTGDTLRAKLILTGVVSECEVIQDILIPLNPLVADFSLTPVDSECPPYVLIDDLTLGATTSTVLTVSDGRTFDEIPERIEFDLEGDYTITLTQENETFGCSSEAEESFILDTDAPAVDLVVVPNLDSCLGNYIATTIYDDTLGIPIAGIGLLDPTGSTIELDEMIDDTTNLFKYLSLDSFLVEQVVLFTNGCKSSSTAMAPGGGVFSVQVPNLFTPNNDSNNDRFRHIVLTNSGEVSSDCVDLVKMKIFDKYGNLVYDRDDGTNGWDGSIGGSPAPADVYLYTIEVQYQDGSRELFKGNVMLMY